MAKKNRRSFFRLFFDFIFDIIDFVKHYFGGIFKKLVKHDIFFDASSLSFSLIICALPLTLILVWAFGYFVNFFELKEQLHNLIIAVIPYEATASKIEEILFKRINNIRDYSAIAGYIGLGGLFITASGFFSSVRKVLNEIFLVKDSDNFLLLKLKDIFMIFLFIFLFSLTFVIYPFLEIVGKISTKINKLFLLSFHFEFFHSIIFEIFSFTVIFLAFFFLYFFIPQKKITHKAAIIGSLWATIFWEMAKYGFLYYLSRFNTWSFIYGAYSLIIIGLFWIYYSSVVLLLGAIISQLYIERQNKKRAI